MIEKTPAYMVELDRFDIAILEILQKDNKTPQRSIAETIGLSAPAVQRRIKRMEETGTIAANVAIIEPTSKKPSKIGYSFDKEGNKIRVFKRTGKEIK